MVGAVTRANPHFVEDFSHHEVLALTTGMHRGDEQSYRAFYDQYFPRLFGYLLVLTNGNADDAEELMQQTLIKVASKIKPFHEPDHFWRWLASIAKNTAFDSRRGRKRYLSLLDRFWRWRSPAPAQRHDETRLQSAVEEAILTLDAEGVRLLELRYQEGRSMREIADALCTTEKAVESRLARLRADLKKRALEVLRRG